MEPKFQFYTGGIYSNVPEGFVKLSKFIDSIERPTNEMVALIARIREATIRGDREAKTKLKESLPFFTPAVIVKGKRKYDDIDYFTGYCQIDIDKISNAIELKNHIFNEYKSIVCAYLSPSGKGVKAIMKIPVCKTVLEYQGHYKAIIEEFGQFDGLDEAPKNAVLPLFYSYDYFSLSRTDSETWTGYIEQKLEPHRQSPTRAIDFDPNIQNDWRKEKTIRIFENKIRSITSDGHPQFRAACLVLGTRVGAGYISEIEARTLIFGELFLCSYLQKDLKGYERTGLWALNEGMKTPKEY